MSNDTWEYRGPLKTLKTLGNTQLSKREQMRVELENVDSILTQFLGEPFLASIGADNNGSRPLHIRVMRVVDALQDRIKELESKHLGPHTLGHKWWCESQQNTGYTIPCSCGAEAP